MSDVHILKHARYVEISVQGILSEVNGLIELVTEEGHELEADDVSLLRTAARKINILTANAEREARNVFG